MKIGRGFCNRQKSHETIKRDRQIETVRLQCHTNSVLFFVLLFYQKLSSSLKERLKRCGRYHSSPVGAPQSKRICSGLDNSPTTGRDCNNRTRSTIFAPAKTASEDRTNTGSCNQISTPSKSPAAFVSTTPLNRKNDPKNTFVTPVKLSGFGDNSGTPENQKCTSLDLTPSVEFSVESSSAEPMSEVTKHSDSCHGSISKKSGNACVDEKGVFPDLCPVGPDVVHTPVRSRSVLSSCQPVASRLEFSGANTSRASDSAAEVTCKPTDGGIKNIPLSSDGQSGMNSCSKSKEDGVKLLQQEYEKLKYTLSEKEEELRKLNMVKVYRTKVSHGFTLGK